MSAAADNVKLHDSWKQQLADEFSKPYFQSLRAFLLSEKEAGAVIYPPGPQIFNALDTTTFDKVKVVIIGQDPYHGAGQANGLCFSVADGIRKPPSLRNIFKELNNDLNIPIPQSGNLQKWAERGVLLLNTVLTVRKGQAGSHKEMGWEDFTNTIIKTLSNKKENLVFILWGNFAKEKEKFIDTSKHLILTGAHPVSRPPSRGFFNRKYFSETNKYLVDNNLPPIDWNLE